MNDNLIPVLDLHGPMLLQIGVELQSKTSAYTIVVEKQ